MIWWGHDHGMTSISSARTLVKADGSFELGYGAVVIVLVVTGVIAGRDLTVSTTVLVAVAVSFLVAGASQLVYFFRAPRRVLYELAIGNAGMAIAGLAWLIASRGFAFAGVLVVSVGIAWKIAIGVLQLRSLRARTMQPHSS